MKKLIPFVLLLMLTTSFTAEKPRILIIGDSISIGYTPFVKELLKEKAVVVHNPGNAQHTGTGLDKLDEWLGAEKWDVIQFNWGLWDLCYRSPDSKVQGNRDKINGTQTFSPEEYEKNLDELVLRLKETGAKLVFVTTSYVPQGEAGHVFGDDKVFNRAAKRVMRKNHVLVNDLNRVSKRIHAKHAEAPGNVHYTKEGYRQLGEVVARYLEEHCL